MAPHQQRVVEEKAELDAKRDKLRVFINGDEFKALDTDERGRLDQQFQVMAQYSIILGKRIAAF